MSGEGGSLCRGCKQPVVWTLTASGKRMPLDPGSQMSHFVTCPKAAQFRRVKQKQAEKLSPRMPL